MENTKRRVIIKRNDSNKNQVFDFDSYYKAWATYYYYKDRIGLGRIWDDIIIDVELI